MIRRIHCEACDRKTRPQHPEDVAQGWKRRRVQIRAQKPAEHIISVVTASGIDTYPLHSLHCDGCGVELKDGSPAFALTEWQEPREAEPVAWEQEYSQPI